MGNYVRCHNLNSSCIWSVEYENLIRPDDCRYEIYLDEVKPNDLSVNFLQEFMDLPIFYLAPGAAIKFRKYLLLCLSMFKLLFSFLAINSIIMLLHVTYWLCTHGLKGVIISYTEYFYDTIRY